MQVFSIVRDLLFRGGFFPDGQMPLLAKTAICFEVIHDFFADERQKSPEN